MDGKKYLLLGVLIPTLLLVGCDNGKFKKGDTVYSGKYEIIKLIDNTERIYEVRDADTGVHYIFNWYDDVLCPYYENNKEVKQTVENEKYKDKE